MMLKFMTLKIILSLLFSFGHAGYWLESRDQYKYYIGTTKVKWTEARRRCEDVLNINLASITNSDDYDHISKELSRNGNSLWLGLRHENGGCNCYNANEDDCKECRDSWVWTDGTDMGEYQPWKMGEPGADETCGRLSHQGWTGYSCNEKFKFVCKADICSSVQCGNGNCTVTNEIARCHCLSGTTGENCQTDIDECLSNPCQNQGSCTDGVNGYTCQCRPGYSGVHCETNANECSSNPCQNEGSCYDGANGYTCQCRLGFSGTHCEMNLDECASSPCSNTSQCIDIVAGYICQCEEGYTGDTCDQDIDECLSEPCSGNGECLDFPNRYHCVCDSNHKEKRCDQEIVVEKSSELLKNIRRKDLVSALIAGVIIAAICISVLVALLFLQFKDRLRNRRKLEEPNINYAIETNSVTGFHSMK